MAKKPTITTIASGYYSRQALNTNFENLRDSFDNTLSLDGSTPNAMGADVDLNSNDILNANNIYTTEVTVGGIPLASNVAAASASAAAALASEVSANLDANRAEAATLGVDNNYATVAALLASTETTRGVGNIWEAGGFRYEEAASGATDQHVTTAGGVKLYAIGDAISTAQVGLDLSEAESAASDGNNVVSVNYAGHTISAKINKSSATLWQGAGRGRLLQTGSRLVSGFNGDNVVINDNATTYYNGGMSDIRFENDISLYPNAWAVSVKNGIRQQSFDRLTVFGYERGLMFQGGGEYHFNDVYVFNCDYSFYFNGGADSWLWGCHGGDGSGAPGGGSYTGSQGYGFYFTGGANNMHLMACRPQVSGKYGLYIDDGQRFQIVSNTIDQSNLGGAIITGDSDQIVFSGGQVFDNGTTSVNGAGVLLAANTGQQIGSVAFDNVLFYDRNRGTALQRQDRGINIFTAPTGSIDVVTVSGCDFSGVDKGIRIVAGSNIGTLIVDGCNFTGCNTPIEGIGSATIGQIIITGNAGIYGQSDGSVNAGDADLTATTTTPRSVRFATTLTADRTFTLPNSGMVPGTEYTVSRSATGDFPVIITVAGGSDKAILTASGTSATFEHDGSSWLVTRGPERQRASTAELSSVTDRINTVLRPAGISVFNHTLDQVYISTGPAAGNGWSPLTKGTILVPS